MNLKSLRKFLAIGLLFVAGHSWATVSQPQNTTPIWNDIAGVAWSTDSGASWGQSALTVGQSVEFKLTLHKEYDGKHYADFIKAWIDWNGDEQFSSVETLLFGYHVVNGSYRRNSSTPDAIVNQYFDFISSPVTITSGMIGEHFLLARVTCSESLLNTAGVSSPWGKQWKSAYTSGNNTGYNTLFSPTAAYHQGESELVKLAVNGQQVPEPGTVALLAAAMLGLGIGRKRVSRV